MSPTNVTGQDFTAIAHPVGEAFTISGTITGDVIDSVEINLSGTAIAQTFTNPSGAYSFTDLQAGTYAIIPTHVGYTFDPPFRIITLSNA